MIYGQIRDYLATLQDYNLRSHADIIQTMIAAESEAASSSCDFCGDHYSRRIIHQVNDFDIVLIGWQPGQLSPIHDHPTNGCIVYPISGTLSEWRYDQDLNQISNCHLSSPSYTYIDNGICIHKLGNEDRHENAVSVHIYSPCDYQANIYNTDLNSVKSSIILP